MPTVEGLQFAYALHPLEPGGFLLHRWRWELWHGPALMAAGWRLSRPDAERALRKHASGAAHRLFGLRSPDPRAVATSEPFRPGAAVRVQAGPVTCLLVPRPVQDEHRTLLARG